jgi:hypothetical protein
LMAWASRQSTWAIGFLDEVWWSRLAGQRSPRPPGRTVLAEGRSRPQSAGLLWRALARGNPTGSSAGPDLAARCDGAPRKSHLDAVSGVVLYSLGPAGQDQLAADLG